MAEYREHVDVDDYHESHHEDEEGTRWWPLLMLPIAFFLGWGANDVMTDTSGNQASENAQPGIGGGPDTGTTVTPTGTPTGTIETEQELSAPDETTPEATSSPF